MRPNAVPPPYPCAAQRSPLTDNLVRLWGESRTLSFPVVDKQSPRFRESKRFTWLFPVDDSTTGKHLGQSLLLGSELVKANGRVAPVHWVKAVEFQ